MNKKVVGLLSFSLAIIAGFSLLIPTNSYADEETQNTEETAATEEGGASISLSPVSKVLQLSSGSIYEDSFDVTNKGKSDMRIEVYAAPYSYVYSEEINEYQLGFSKENNFTQIARWIKFQNSNGEYEEKPQFVIKPGDTLTVHYRVSTPNNIPAGGQYAVMFAHTLSEETGSNGIRTEASPGIIVYGRSTEGEVALSGTINNLAISQSIADGETTKNWINASAKVKNNGNVDFNASGVLKVQGLFGGDLYETEGGRGMISVIPEAELTVSDKWEETPSFGIFRVTWTVTALDQQEVIEQIVFVNPMPFVIIIILLLTIIVIWITIMLRKRKERRSRLAV